ncbi:hypothetical protein BaRGS_00010156 [Batillaria attramentaria]|uniref:Uncharacterized protein n=1 Tax=Batillaria attramentaria TaxID=370345 RepID=A0ABD0LH12_9CAEN|nr:hypothetical protein BaRGS_003285 [Batillaria attramentaria]
MLRRVARDQLDVTIAEVMDTVCVPDNFDITEYSKDTLSDACNHLISEHGSVLETILISHFGRSNRPSYLDLVQQVCQDVTDACHGVSHDDHDHDPLKDDARVKLDRDTNEFVVLPGKNLKMPRPVAESRDEL